MREHQLKIHPDHFAAVNHDDPYQRKRVELRKDDRGYQVGDYLVLKEFDPTTEKFTGRQCIRLVTHITRGQPWLSDGYVALSILQNV